MLNLDLCRNPLCPFLYKTGYHVRHCGKAEFNGEYHKKISEMTIPPTGCPKLFEHCVNIDKKD